MRAILVAIALVAVVGRASAQDDAPELQRMRFIERDTNLTVTTNISKLFDSASYEGLQSGFPSTIVIATAVYPRNGSDPVTVGKEVRTIVYDLWDEQYVIRIEGAGGRKTKKVKYRAEALKILTAVEDMPIARLADIPYEDIFYLRLTVQLNPVSKETLAEVRRWLSQGTGGGLDRGGVFFGSFVSVFVNPKIADADRVLRIRSQPFYRPKP
ncbi:MAG TPA: DUF4390 domain-containing protein [Kofleriaceae bacterium]|nr:DUF4390 domain-containing protein [Kofleriaceae bacterium]